MGGAWGEEKGKDQQDQNGSEGEKGNEDKQGQKPQEMGMSKEDAERLLEALNEAENATQEKVQQKKIKVGKSTIEKDW